MRTALSFALLLLVSLAAADQYAVHRISYGGEESSWKPFQFPSDVWVDDASDRLFISDPFNYAVQVYTTELEHLSIIGGNLNNPAGLSQPKSVTFAHNRIYVVDPGVGGVRIFDSGYSSIDSMLSGGSSAYQFNVPSGIAVDGNKNIYVADTGNNRIQVYDDNLEYQNTIGEYGTVGDNALNSPRGLFIKDDVLYIADSGNNRIKLVHTNGTFIKSIGIGAGGVTLYQPMDVAVGFDNKIYVADTLNDRVVVFSPAGNPLATIEGNLSGKYLDNPSGIYVDSRDYIYVADTDNNRIIVLKPTSEIPAIALNASDEISAAASEISEFNALVDAIPEGIEFTGGDRGAASYLELAREEYDEGDYTGASETARLARSLIAEARQELEKVLNFTLSGELEVLMARLDLYDQNISAGELEELSTEELRSQADEISLMLENSEYVEAATSLNLLEEGADQLEADINAELEEAKKSRQELMASLDWILDASSELKERASYYRQALNTTALDMHIENASFLLSRDLFSATKEYEIAYAEYQELNSTLEEIIGKIIDANETIAYAAVSYTHLTLPTN